MFLLTSCGRKGEPTLTTFQQPDQVIALKAEHMQDKIILTWSIGSAFNLKGFHVERSAGDSGFKALAFNKPDQMSFVDKSFSAGTVYEYRVRAVSSRDIAGAYSPVKTVTPRKLPQPPSWLKYRTQGDYVEISWESIPGAVYNLYKTAGKDKEPSELVNLQPLKEPLFKEKMNFTTDVYYAVRSLLTTELKDEGYSSKMLLISPAFFVPVAPSGIRHAQSKDKVVLIWNENIENWISGYRIYRKRSGEDMFSAIGETAVPAYTDSSPASVKTFYYITALGQGSESRSSAEIEVKPLVER
ncbi:MAG: fibronectin type III domain-containing protein [Nitrospirae bacterium]|nr:fibronectin type III domain-containing protein [Nitrospirota bacterium]